MQQTRSFVRNVRANYHTLKPKEQAVANYILEHAREVCSMSLSELVKASGSSRGIVVRTYKKLDFPDYYELRLILASELEMIETSQNRRQAKPPQTASESISSIQADSKTKWAFEKTIEHAQDINMPSNEEGWISSLAKRQANTVLATIESLDETTVYACAKLLRQSHAVYIGAVGNTIPVAMDLSYRLTSLGICAYASPTPELTLNHIHSGRMDDVLLLFSKGTAPEVLMQAAGQASMLGMKIILITANEESALLPYATYALKLVTKHQAFPKGATYSHINEFAVCDALLSAVQR